MIRSAKYYDRRWKDHLGQTRKKEREHKALVSEIRKKFIDEVKDSLDSYSECRFTESQYGDVAVEAAQQAVTYLRKKGFGCYYNERTLETKSGEKREVYLMWSLPSE